MNRDEHERDLFDKAFRPPGEPYDLGQPFDANELMDGFTGGDEVHLPVDPSSALGRAMAAAREAWAQPGYQPIDPETFAVAPIPVEMDEDEPPVCPERS